MNVIVSSIDRILNFGKAQSLWPLTFGASCCGVELLQAVFSHNGFAGANPNIFNNSPKQADLLICTGAINAKTAPILQKLYLKMPEPKYVIAMGVCAISGGMFCDSYTKNQGVDSILPVDTYLPGCPPKPEALIEALEKLKNGIRCESVLKRKEQLKAHQVEFIDVSDDVKDLNIEYFGVERL